MEFVIPQLRGRGFTGSFPHLRRVRDGAVDLLTFQFDRHGGSLTIELAKCRVDGIDHPSLGHISAEKARAWDRHPNYRIRIGDHSRSNAADQWFPFSERDPKTVCQAILAKLEETIWTTLSAEGSETPYASPPK
jgi:hypothetical protein